MSRSQLNLIYALKGGNLVHISNADSGLKCGCTCPACGEPLVAKKGAKTMHHFAHYTKHFCEYGYETSLHFASKEILSQCKKMIIPCVKVVFADSYKKDEIVSEAREVSIDHVELEKKFNDIVPDIVVYVGKRKFFIEIFVTHPIDEVKLKRIKSQNVSTIEIDLSKKDKIISAEELADILINDSKEKTWKYNVVADNYLNKFYKVAYRKEYVLRQYALHIDDCPIAFRSWRGKPYANLMDDCLYCEYCISNEHEKGYILCSGRLRISHIKDFDIPMEERIRISNKKISDEKEQLLASGRCPNCGGELVERESKYGTFWGCSNYPHCRFTASVDSETGELKTKS